MIALEPEDRGLPKASGEEWEGGTFEGWMALVDIQAGKLLCERSIAFERSESVRTGGGVDVGLKVGPKVNVGGTGLDGAISQDFLERATAAIRAGATELSGDKVKLVF